MTQTGIQIKDIKDALVEKKNVITKYNHNSPDGKVIDPTGYRINTLLDSAITQQGQVEIGLNREKLIQILHKVSFEKFLGEPFNVNYYKPFFDSIIANQKDLFEVVK